MTRYKSTLNFGVAKDMSNPITRSVRDVGSFFGVLNQDTDEGHSTNSIDWVDNLILTPCDCELAVNEWGSSDGRHRSHIRGSSESYSTRFVMKCGDGYIFGNGGHLYHYNAKVASLVKRGDKSFDIDSLTTSKCGTVILSLLKGIEPELILFKRFTTPEYHHSKTSFNKEELLNVNNSNWDLTIFNGTHNTAADRVALYAFTENSETIGNQELIIFDLDYEKVLKKFNIHGLETIIYSPYSDEICAIGKKIWRISMDNYSILSSTTISGIRSTNNRMVAAYTSDGKRFANSFDDTGSVEIRDSISLQIIYRYPGYGVPQNDLAWDSSGRYLACRYKKKANSEYVLVVWDTINNKEILFTPTSSSSHKKRAFVWSPNTAEIASLVDNKRVQVFSLS